MANEIKCPDCGKTMGRVAVFDKHFKGTCAPAGYKFTDYEFVPVDEYTCGFISHTCGAVVVPWERAMSIAQNKPRKLGHKGDYIFLLCYKCYFCGGVFFPKPEKYEQVSGVIKILK